MQHVAHTDLPGSAGIQSIALCAHLPLQGYAGIYNCSEQYIPLATQPLVYSGLDACTLPDASFQDTSTTSGTRPCPRAYELVAVKGTKSSGYLCCANRGKYSRFPGQYVPAFNAVPIFGAGDCVTPTAGFHAPEDFNSAVAPLHGFEGLSVTGTLLSLALLARGAAGMHGGMGNL